MEIYKKNSEKLHVARTRAMQHATFEDIGATGNATQVQPTNMKALARLVLERNRQRNSSATHAQKQRNFQRTFEAESCGPSCTIFEAEKHTEHQIRIERMATCLHGRDCRFISFVDDRQVCSRNNKGIFDMAACPVGKWWTPKLMDKAKANTMHPTRCFCCGGQTRKITEAGAGYAASVICQCYQKIR